VYVYTCITVIDTVFSLERSKTKRYRLRNRNRKKILRQCSILAVNFWSVTYFGVLNFGTSYLGAKISQNKTHDQNFPIYGNEAPEGIGTTYLDTRDKKRTN
jgi:hypothetical protein